MLVPIIPYYNLRNTNTQVQVGAVCTLYCKDIHSKTKKKKKIVLGIIIKKEIEMLVGDFHSKQQTRTIKNASKCCVHVM